MCLCMQECLNANIKKHWRGLLRNSGAGSGTAIPISALRSTSRVQIIPNETQAIHQRETGGGGHALQVMFVRDKTIRMGDEGANSYC